MARVLVVDDEQGIRETLSEFLQDEGHLVAVAESVRQAERVLAADEWDVVVTDIIMPDASGLELLRGLHATAPRVKVILITGEPSFASATEALRHGAVDYLSKPVVQSTVCRAVAAAARLKQLEDENSRYREYLEQLVEERTFQIREYNERLRQVAEQTKSFTQSQDLEDLAPKILTLFAQNMSADGGSFFRDENGHLALAHTLDPGHQPPYLPLPPPPGSVLARVLECKEGFVLRNIAEDRALHPSGWTGYRDGSLLALPCLDADGRVRGIVTIHNKRDPPFTEEDLEIGRIIAGHSVEALHALALHRRLRESEQRYKELSEHSLTGILVSQDDRLVYLNPRLADILGYPVEALTGTATRTHVHPDDWPLLAGQSGQAAPQPGQPVSHHEARLLRRDGSQVWVEMLISTIELAGRPALMGNVIDISQRRRAEAEKASLEAQFLQSQKLEAIGRLAGGVAHDFNNLLTGIMGFAEMVLERLAPDRPERDDVVQIATAAERAAALTRQLLAFSRKQVIEPRLIGLNEVITQSHKMLARLIGEDIQLTLTPAADLWPIRADPIQIDQILVNLATNARDAMPRGGRLHVETGNVGWAGGDRVRLTVSDTGCGMDDGTRARIFEPFFSTKEHGTGLGLATVHDIVTQLGGSIRVESAPGAGAKVTIEFPRAPLGATETSAAQPQARRATGQETVLLVEDDPAVRQLLQEALTRLGYRVLQAREADEAQQLSAAHAGEIHLLITDVVLPGRNGRDLYQSLVALRPRLKVLFVSGYAQDVITRHGGLADGLQLLQKPFTLAALALKVRAVLEA